MKPQTILFADDDPEIREVVELLLTGEGYQVVAAADGTELLKKLTPDVDLVILDIMMPGLSGYSVCTEIRKRSSVPVLFLTAKSQDSDKTLGFSVGADDYLAKPFSYSELVSRVKALLRRYCVYGAKQAVNNDIIHCCDTVEIDQTQQIVRRGGNEVLLTETEYRIFLLLATHKKKIFSAQNIYESVWGEPYFYSSNNTVMVHIRNIRRKLGDTTKNGKTLQTVWGKGYRIE